MNPDVLKKQNRTALRVLVVAALLVAILLTFPAYVFRAGIYTKKSSNTVVGDEKYLSVLEEVNRVAEEYREKGFDVEVGETVTERTNSKGEVSSLVTFSISQEFTKSGWSFLSARLPSSILLTVLLSCMLLSLACAFAGSLGTMDELPRTLDARASLLRTAAGVFALVAFLLIPVFVMSNTVIFSRKLTLYGSGTLTEGAERYYQKVGSFLFGSAAGEDPSGALKGLTFHSTAAIWLTMLPLFGMVLAAIQLRHGSISKTLMRGLLYTFVIIVCVITLYPYYVMLVSAFRSNAETNDMYFLHLLPTKWIWSNLNDIINRGVLRYLLNSGMIAGGATLIAMLCGIPAAYAMARMNFKGKKAFLGFVIMSQMFSPVVLLIGIAQLMSTLKLNDTILGLMFINAAFNQAFAIWLLRGTFVSISPEMEQAAKIDGCNTMQSLLRVLLPMAAPGIVTTLIFIFINAWNEYTISTVLISTASNRPITVGITQFSSFNMIEWQYLFAASLLATIPVVILFMCIEKHLVSGLTSGGVKG